MPEYPAGFEPDLGGLHGFFAGLIDEGLSQNKAIDAFREAGGSASNTFLRGLYNETLNNRMAAPEGWAHPLHRIPGDDDFAPWSGGRQGTYGYPVSMQVVDDAGDIRWVDSMLMSDRIMSKADVFSLAIDQYLSGEDFAGERYAADVISAEYRSQPFAFTGEPL